MLLTQLLAEEQGQPAAGHKAGANILPVAFARYPDCHQPACNRLEVTGTWSVNQWYCALRKQSLTL